MSEFAKYIIANYEDQLAHIAKHGCEGGINGLIYYTELIDLYDKYTDDIHDLHNKYVSESGCENVSTDVLVSKGSLCTYLIWLAVEMIANQHLSTIT